MGYSSLLQLFEWYLGSLAMLAEEICPEERFDPGWAALRRKHCIEDWWAKSWGTAVLQVIRRRRLFISNSELIGMGPDSAEPGDIICILLGCSTPVILRPQDDHYIFLGEAYVHGYMYGKGMDELAEGKFQLESFEIH